MSAAPSQIADAFGLTGKLSAHEEILDFFVNEVLPLLIKSIYKIKVVTMSDSNGYIYDPNGINLDIVLDLKNVKRARISEYAKLVPGSEYHEGSKGVWTVKCDIALPCATQNELDLEGAKALIANGVKAVAEGANMPSTPEAIEAFQKAGVLFGPAKAANAGGVATSGLEMSQNSERLSWTFEEVDKKLEGIMVLPLLIKSIYKIYF